MSDATLRGSESLCMSLVCLSCKLPVCDDQSPECEYTTRRQYFTQYYQINREPKIEAAKSRYHTLKLDPEWRAKRNERKRERRMNNV